MIEKILLDTDIGTDIDDAIVMSYLLKQKKCEIVGITVTGGEQKNELHLPVSCAMQLGNLIFLFIPVQISHYL